MWTAILCPTPCQKSSKYLLLCSLVCTFCKPNFYYEKYRKYSNSINHGKLNVPSDHIYQWLVFCYILFYTIKGNVCQITFSCLFQNYIFLTHKESMLIFFQIHFLKNYCKHYTPELNKKSALKASKFSKVFVYCNVFFKKISTLYKWYVGFHLVLFNICQLLYQKIHIFLI